MCAGGDITWLTVLTLVIGVGVPAIGAFSLSHSLVRSLWTLLPGKKRKRVPAALAQQSFANSDID